MKTFDSDLTAAALTGRIQPHNIILDVVDVVALLRDAQFLYFDVKDEKKSKCSAPVQLSDVQ